MSKRLSRSAVHSPTQAPPRITDKSILELPRAIAPLLRPQPSPHLLRLFSKASPLAYGCLCHMKRAELLLGNGQLLRLATLPHRPPALQAKGGKTPSEFKPPERIRWCATRPGADAGAPGSRAPDPDGIECQRLTYEAQ